MLRFAAILLTFFSVMSTFCASAANAGNVGVMIVDMQPEFRPKDSRLWDSLVEQQLELLDWAKKNSIPVILVEYVGAGATDDRIMNKLGEFPTWQVRHVIKQKDGAFADFRARDRLLEIYQEWKLEAAIATGVNATSCVSKTIHTGSVEPMLWGVRWSTSRDLIADFYCGNRKKHTYPAGLDMTLDYGGKPPEVFSSRAELQSCQRFLSNEKPANADDSTPFSALLPRLKSLRER